MHRFVKGSRVGRGLCDQLLVGWTLVESRSLFVFGLLHHGRIPANVERKLVECCLFFCREAVFALVRELVKEEPDRQLITTGSNLWRFEKA